MKTDPTIVKQHIVKEVKKDPIKGVITVFDDMPPFKGIPADDFIHVSQYGVKNIALTMLYLVAHTPVWISFLFPKFRAKFFDKINLMFDKSLHLVWDKVGENWCKSSQEIKRAIETQKEFQGTTAENSLARYKMTIYEPMTMEIKFSNNQEKAGFNEYGHYQFGSNCCVMCKRDRPLNEKGLYCEYCMNPANSKEKEICPICKVVHGN